MNPATNLAFQSIDQFIQDYGVDNTDAHNGSMRVRHGKSGGEYWWLGTIPYVDKEPVYDYDGLFCLRAGLLKIKGIMRTKSSIPDRKEYDIDFCWAGLAQCHIPVVTGTPLVVYQSCANSRIWFRPKEEFLAKFKILEEKAQ